MEEIVLPGDPPVAIRLRRSRRSRRLSLRVSAVDGRVTMSVPARVDAREARAFAAEKEAWIRRHLGARPAPERPVIGGVLMYRGAETPVRAGAVRAVTEDAGVLWVPERKVGAAPVLLRAFLKEQARAALVAASDAHAASLGRRYGRITLRDTRSRWGSCSSEGNLMYSWRLIMAPPEVLDYVAAHEVAHLEEMNHSPAYWAVVERLMPGYAAPRDWLRRNGTALHRWHFGD